MRTDKLNKIASFGYGVYSIPCGYGDYDVTGQLPTDRYAVADLFDGPDGYYLTVSTVEDAFAEMESAGVLTDPMADSNGNVPIGLREE